MMNVVFRVDASLEIGTGHVMRCLTLANALKARGAHCTFICRAHSGHLGKHIEAAGHRLHLLPIETCQTNDYHTEHTDLYTTWLGCPWEEDAKQTAALLNNNDHDWLVVDHYGLDMRWETTLRCYTKQLMVIDDLANRAHDCDVLLDQNLGRQRNDYASLVSDECNCLIGPAYALLRPEFAEWREYSLKRRQLPQLKQLLVSLGGVDKDNITGQVLKALHDCQLPEGCRVTTVMGPHAPWLNEVREQAKKLPWRCDVRVDVKNMAQLMADSDLAIGAAGSTSWERCALGLPTVMLVLAANQRGVAAGLARAGAVQLIPSVGDITSKLSFFVSNLVISPELLIAMSQASASLTEGQGLAAIAEYLEQ